MRQNRMIIRTIVSSLIIPVAICLSTPTLDNPPSVMVVNVQEPPATQSLTDTISNMVKNENKKKTKTIYLIRHAESLENVAYKGARRVQAAYVSRKLPERADIIDAAKLTFKMFRPSVMNAELSELGRRQVLQLHDRLEQDQFLVTDVDGKEVNGDSKNSERPQILIAHSPLKRAKQTAYGSMFGPNYLDANAQRPDMIAPDRVVELEALREVNPLEIVKDALNVFAKDKTVDHRIKDLEEWIQEQDDDQAIVMVGHSVYFKRMLNLPDTFGNCDIWEAEYDLEDASKTVNGEDEDKEDGMMEKMATQMRNTVTMIVNDDKEMEFDLPRSWKSLKRLYFYTPEQIPEVDEEAGEEGSNPMF